MAQEQQFQQNNGENLTRKEKIEIRRSVKEDEGTRLARKRKMRRFLIWFGSALAVGLIFWGLIKLAVTSPSVSGELSVPPGAEDWQKGGADAKAVIVEYSDFQCPACALFYPIIKQILADNPDKIKVIYRHFPLSQHKNAPIAAYATEAAGLQGKFWEMHDKIFDNQTEWSEKTNARDIITGYAGEMGLDLGRFKKDIDSDNIKNKVEGDYKSGLDSGVDSTPTFFLNGKKMSAPKSYEDFRNTIIRAADNPS